MVRDQLPAQVSSDRRSESRRKRNPDSAGHESVPPIIINNRNERAEEGFAEKEDDGTAKEKKKKRKRKRRNGGEKKPVKSKYPWTPREATPGELLAVVAGGLLTSRAINIFIRRFLRADRLNAPHARRYHADDTEPLPSICEINWNSWLRYWNFSERVPRNILLLESTCTAVRRAPSLGQIIGERNKTRETVRNRRRRRQKFPRKVWSASYFAMLKYCDSFDFLDAIDQNFDTVNKVLVYSRKWMKSYIWALGSFSFKRIARLRR